MTKQKYFHFMKIILYKSTRRMYMSKLNGKSLILLGERDGIPSLTMEACFKGEDIAFSSTECFV